MRLLFGVQFQIRPPTGVTEEDAVAQAKARIVEWIRNWYAQWKAHDLDFPEDDKRYAPLDRHSLLPTSATAFAGESVWGLTWSYPDEQIASQRWEIKVVLSRAAGTLEFSLTINLASSTFEVSPFRYTFGPPKIVADLIDSFPCFSGSQQLTTQPKVVSPPEIEPLVNDLLLNSDRRVPVVAVSPWGGVDSSNAVVDASAVARRLAGLAVVVLLSDKYACWSLTDALSKELSCYQGAVRVYWPGLTRESNPYSHPLFLPLTILKLQSEGTRMEDFLFRRVANTAAARYVEGPVFRQVRESIQRQQAARQVQLLVDLKSSRASAEERTTKIAELEAALRQKDEELDYLRSENENLRSQWIDYQRLIGREEAAAPIPEELPEITSVEDAVNLAERKFSKRIRFGEEAKESARESVSKQYLRVYEAFEAMNDVAEERFRAKAEGRSMGMDLERAFRKRGFSYASGESMTAMGGKLGSQRRFRVDGKVVTMERHLKIGGGDRENPVRIYFEIVEEEGCFVVGYCGMHLDIPRGRT